MKPDLSLNTVPVNGAMMNVRIEELLEQATTSIKDEYGHWIGSELDEEKFAELIVRK